MKKNNVTLTLTPLLLATFLAAAGIALIAVPMNIISILLRVIGALILLGELVRLYPIIRAGSSTGLFIFALSEFFAVTAAIILLINPIGAIRTVCFIFGLYLIVGSLVELRRMARYNARFVSYIAPSLTLITGLVLIFFPAGVTELTLTVIGISMLIKAADISIAELQRKKSGKSSDSDGTYVVTDFKDVSGK